VERHLFVPNKLEYVRGKRPSTPCILCAIKERRKEVKCLDVYRTEHFIVSLNLYPYNPAHLLIFPKRHILDVRQLLEEETKQMHELLCAALSVLEKVYEPAGFNIGYNIGREAGASIEHLHLHIVPRYRGELGFVDIMSGARIMVEDPQKTQEKLKEAFAKIKV
jgi:ATP adenylyltransferase